MPLALLHDGGSYEKFAIISDRAPFQATKAGSKAAASGEWRDHGGLERQSRQRSKIFVYQNKNKKRTLEKSTARFVVRSGRGLGPAASQGPPQANTEHVTPRRGGEVNWDFALSPAGLLALSVEQTRKGATTVQDAAWFRPKDRRTTARTRV